MNPLSRRHFLSAVAAAAPRVASARTLQNVGAQLYTVRNVILEKPAETLRAIEKIGYREVEVVGAMIPKIWDSLKQTSLKPVSVHLDTALFLKKTDQLPPAIEDAKHRGFSYVVCPYIAPADRGGVDVIKKLAENLNQAGEQCKTMGLKLCYHNHAFEFAPASPGGSERLLDVLMKNADPKLVWLEMDLMWAKVGGADPAALLKQYSGRVAHVHLKDLASGIPSRFDEGIARSGFMEVGKGVIDWPATLKAAQAAKVHHYFVEQDTTPGDPLVSLQASFDYLKKTNF